MNKSSYNTDEQGALTCVRNSLLHDNIYFDKEQVKKFYEVMKREGIEKEWPLPV